MTFGKGERGGVFYIPLSSLKIVDSIYASQHCVALVLGATQTTTKSAESQKQLCTSDNTEGVQSDMQVGGTIPHHDYLKNISNQEILFSISSGGMKLLPQTPSSVTHLLSMMDVPWHNSLLARILWYVIHMGSKVRNNSSTHFRIISSTEEL